MLELITVLSSLVPALLAKFGVATSIDNLITVSLSALVALWGSLTGKTTGTTDAVLVGLQAAVTALEADTSIDPAVLGDISEGLTDLKASIAAYQAAQVTTDPSTLGPIPTLT